MNGYEFWTLLIAGSAFVLAAISLGWNIALHLMHRPKVEVYASIMRVYPAPTGMDEDDDVLVLTAVNARSRPVTVTGFYGELEKQKDDKNELYIKGSSEPFANLAKAMPCQIDERVEC